MNTTASIEKPETKKLGRPPKKDPWIRVIIPKKEPQKNEHALAEVDKAYAGVMEEFEENRKSPKSLVVNRKFRNMFRNVMAWGDKPCIPIEVDRSDTDDKPSFYFEY